MSKLLAVLQLPSILTPLVTIDVGVNTGICVYHHKTIELTTLLKEKAAHKKLNVSERVMFLADQVEDFLSKNRISPEITLIEGVQVYGSSQKSMASTLSGDTIMVAYMTGAFAAVCSTHSRFTRIVLPRQWKGNMNKDVVKARIKRVTDIDYPDHIADAVGMMLSLRGVL